ncbi:MAG: CBS domain-containing protein, partial [Candidatus Abyssobacteria bacterium SURF_5]
YISTSGKSNPQKIRGFCRFLTKPKPKVSKMSLMYDRSIHRIPVLRDGKVVGLVTAMDVVRMVADGKQE